MSQIATCLRAGVLALACFWSAVLQGADTSVIDSPFLGVIHIFRTGSTPNFPRNVKMHIVKIDLTTPGLSFKLSPPGGTRDTVRQTVLAFANAQSAQVAMNVHFFLPFPSADLNADLVGFGASQGTVFSPFEIPSQNYAIVRDAPGLNIDASNRASIVTRAAGFSDGTCHLCVTNDGLHVNERVTLWNTVAGSAQIVTNGVKSLPCYVDALNPGCALVGPGPAGYSNANSWYNLTNARTSIGLTQDRKTLVLFTVDNAGGSSGMRVGEVADLLIADYGVYDALNLDGGGSTTMVFENPVTHVRALVNTSSNGATPREVATSLGVFAPAKAAVTHTFNTSPADLSTTVDGAPSSSPQSPVWTFGSSHTIATTSR